jgi:2-succinyl-6-hydroxy-2,4-cyclohexadiene-1-carboxylate synthase
VGDPIVLLHGFTQSGASWQPVIDALTRPEPCAHQVITVDAPGHGGSSTVVADLWSSAKLIVDAAGPGTYVGYSMGARMALHVALARPDAVRRLVLVSGTAGIEDAEERARRRASDEDIARRLESDGVEAFVRWWLQRPLFATLPAGAAALDSRVHNTVDGLAASLRHAGTGTQEPLWDRLGHIDVPTLVVAGALDEAYAARAGRLVASIGSNATLAMIEGAGHACHLERPQAFQSLLRSFLGSHEVRDRG